MLYEVITEERVKCSAYQDRTKPCWERANTACAKDFEHCTSCEVFLQAMKEVRDSSSRSASNQ